MFPLTFGNERHAPDSIKRSATCIGWCSIFSDPMQRSIPFRIADLIVIDDGSLVYDQQHVVPSRFPGCLCKGNP